MWYFPVFSFLVDHLPSVLKEAALQGPARFITHDCHWNKDLTIIACSHSLCGATQKALYCIPKDCIMQLTLLLIWNIYYRSKIVKARSNQMHQGPFYQYDESLKSSLTWTLRLPDHDYIVVIYHHQLSGTLRLLLIASWRNSSLFIYVMIRYIVHSFERGQKHSGGLRDRAGGGVTQVKKQTFPSVTWQKADI